MTKYTNEKIPLILSFGACLLFGISIIIAGYFHGKMNVGAVLHNLHNFN